MSGRRKTGFLWLWYLICIHDVSWLVDAANHDSPARDGRVINGNIATLPTDRGIANHSDQGSQYTGEDFQRLLEAHGITCRMSRRGNGWDNAETESFFSTLKTERLGRRQYRTCNEIRADVFDYIER